MKSKIQKIMAIISVVLLMFTFFAACSETRTGRNGSIEISYFKGGTGSEWIEALAAAFERDTGIYVDLIADNNITQNARTKLDSGRNLSDIMFVQLTNWREYVQKGWIAEMDDLYDGTFSYTVDGFTITSSYDLSGTSVYSNHSNTEGTEQVTLRDMILDEFKDYGYIGQTVTSEKHYYVVPWHSPCVGIAYNVSILNEAGWENPPATESELFECIEDIKALGKYSIFAWGGLEFNYWDFVTHTWWAQYEGVEAQRSFYDFESPEVFNQEGRTKALDLWQRLLVASDGSWQNSIPSAVGLDHMSAQNEFAKGNAAFVVTGAFLENEIEAILPENFNFRMMAVPMIDGAKNENRVLNTEAGTFACIPAGSENIEKAKAFLAYMNQPEWIENFTKYSGQMRPFNYKPSSIEGISEYTKSVCELFETSDLLMRVSDSAIFNYAGVKEWVLYSSTSLYTVLSGSDKIDAATACENMYNYAVSNWSTYLKQAGDSEG